MGVYMYSQICFFKLLTTFFGFKKIVAWQMQLLDITSVTFSIIAQVINFAFLFLASGVSLL